MLFRSAGDPGSQHRKGHAMKAETTVIEAGSSRLSPLKRAYTGMIFPGAAFVSALFFTGYYLAGLMVSEEALERIRVLYMLAAACHIIMLPGILLGKRQFGQIMLAANLCWIILSRWLLKDHIFVIESASHWALVFCCFYACGWLLEPKKRELLVKLVTAEVLAVLFVWAAVGLVTALVGHSLPGFERICLKGEYVNNSLVSLSFYDTHRNKTAAFFLCGAGLCLYQCVKNRGFFWKLCALLFLPLAYCIVALQHSRSNYLAFAVMLALTVISLLWDTLRWTDRPVGVIGEILAAGICAVLIYASFGLCSSGLSRLSQRIQTAEARPTAAVEMTEEAAEATADSQESAPLQVTDNRNTLRDAKTLTGRVVIWKGLLRCIKEEPRIGLLGQREKTMMKTVRKYTFPTVAHLHNILFQQLGLAGFPGMLLYILWLLSMARDMIICFFIRKDRESRAPKVLCAVLLGLLVYGVFEPLMSFKQLVSSMMFCLMAGLLAHISVRNDAQQTESV